MNIAISYRRDDSTDITGRIWDRLSQRYVAQVFMDIDDSIPLGSDYREHLEAVFADVRIVLAVVGTKWQGRKRNGTHRIQLADDPVRLELEAAVRNQKVVVPLLVHDAPMPSAAELPETLGRFPFLQALKVDSRSDFHAHIDKLTSFIDEKLAVNGNAAAAETTES